MMSATVQPVMNSEHDCNSQHVTGLTNGTHQHFNEEDQARYMYAKYDTFVKVKTNFLECYLNIHKDNMRGHATE